MNFFRLRVINTVLFFLIGTVLGFILKDRFMPAKTAVSQPRYQPEYSAGAEGAAAVQPETPAEDEAPQEQDQEPAKPEAEEPKPRTEPSRPAPKPAMIEASVLPAEADTSGTRTEVLKGRPGDFFTAPQDYLGRDLELELQMITAKRLQRGWRLNFVYTGPDKKIDYLYVDDDSILGDSPDLRIGYVYRVRFHCSKGETDSGNALTLLTATGDKAAWATGLSAIE